MEPLELKRQGIHITLGLIIIILFYFDILVSWWLLAIFAISLIISLLCQENKLPFMNKYIESFERSKYRRKFPGKGPIFFFLGAWLVTFFFDKNIALAAIAILTFGDALATLISLSNGKKKHPLSNTKLIEGSIVGTIVGFLVASIFVPWWQALIAAFIAMNIEVMEIKIYEFDVDDNLSIPVIAAAIIFILQLI